MFILLVGLLCVAGSYGDFNEIKNVYLKYDALFNGYWPLPKTATEDKEFHHVGKDEVLNLELYSQRNDPRLFVLFDTYGNAAGVRIGYIIADLPKRAGKNNLEYPYKFEDHAMYERGHYWDTDIYHTTILFDDPEVFKNGGRQNTNGIVVENVYLKIKGVWTKISRDQCDAEKMGFTKQGCFVGMGMHYFYNMSESLDCHDFEGLFLLYEYGQLIGVGFIPFGTFTDGPYRSWFEDPPVLAVKMIVPNRPKCLTEWVSMYGTSSLHIYFKDRPRFTACCWPHQKNLDCNKT